MYEHNSSSSLAPITTIPDRSRHGFAAGSRPRDQEWTSVTAASPEMEVYWQEVAGRVAKLAVAVQGSQLGPEKLDFSNKESGRPWHRLQLTAHFSRRLVFYLNLVLNPRSSQDPRIITEGLRSFRRSSSSNMQFVVLNLSGQIHYGIEKKSQHILSTRYDHLIYRAVCLFWVGRESKLQDHRKCNMPISDS